jgi:murein DD-endopeptidase MepM/ murein hydrolase activator NlpD
MRDRFIITVTDVNGTKSYNISQLFTKFAIHLSLFFVVVFILATVSINFLTGEVDRINNKKEQIANEYKTLESKNSKLELKISTKSKELKDLNSKIEDLEDIIGVKPMESMTYNERVDLAKLTTLEKQFIMSQIPSGYPVEYKGISSSFGYRIHPIMKRREFHPGVDLRARMRTKLIAPADGVVEYAGYHKKGYGNLLIIHHNYGFKTVYGHLSKLKVRTGASVKKGQLVALTGNSGLSSGPHLHYEVRFAGRALQPVHFMKWTMKDYDSLFKKQRSIKWQSLINQIKYSKNSLQAQQSLQNVQKFQGK